MHQCCQEEELKEESGLCRRSNCTPSLVQANVAPTPPPVENPTTTSTDTRPTTLLKPKSYRHPQLLTLPSKTAIPVNTSDQQFILYSFLPTVGISGDALFNAFINFCSVSEQNTVLASRVFVSQSFTKQGEMLAIRQVPLITHLNALHQTLCLA